MAILAFKPQNITLDVNDYEMQIGDLYLNGNLNALSNSALEWVPTPTEDIWYIGYKAAVDNAGGNPLIGDYVYSSLTDSFLDNSEVLDSQTWWGYEEAATTAAEIFGTLGFAFNVYIAWSTAGETVSAKYWDLEENKLESANLNISDEGINWGVVTPYQVTYEVSRAGSTEPTAGVQFWGTENKTDEEFLTLANYVKNKYHDTPDWNNAEQAGAGLEGLGFYTNFTSGGGGEDPDQPD